MSNFIINTYHIFTFYELGLIVFALFGAMLFSMISAYFITRDKKIVLIGLLSLITFDLAFLISSYIAQEFWGVETNGMVQISLYMSAVVTIINYIILITEYHKELTAKKFDPDHITRGHFSATLNMLVIVLLVSFSVFPFSPDEVRMILAIFIGTTSLSLVSNHLFARMMLRDNGVREVKE
jgi:hypothetical protein